MANPASYTALRNDKDPRSDLPLPVPHPLHSVTLPLPLTVRLPMQGLLSPDQLRQRGGHALRGLPLRGDRLHRLHRHRALPKGRSREGVVELVVVVLAVVVAVVVVVVVAVGAAVGAVVDVAVGAAVGAVVDIAVVDIAVVDVAVDFAAPAASYVASVLPSRRKCLAFFKKFFLKKTRAIFCASAVSK